MTMVDHSTTDPEAMIIARAMLSIIGKNDTRLYSTRVVCNKRLGRGLLCLSYSL
jgi:hypothetical protein